MRVIADLQIHSKYSRAVSQKMDLFHIAEWAEKKGIDLVATGDWTHPLWFKHILANLEEVDDGVFRLSKKVIKSKGQRYGRETRFILSTEISSIYKQGDSVRRIHTLVFSPSLKTAEKIIDHLRRRGCNLLSDGRPIVGLSVIQIAELVLGIDPNVLIIPAHIWTPWFSLFGSRSGFDSIKEAFGEYEKYIYAVETGLSSDPIMNWQIKELKKRRILSFSDAHSGVKLGREASVFYTKKTRFSYKDLYGAIKGDRSDMSLRFTIEFFPEEGKYHLSGHRDCKVRLTPEEVKEKGKICPVCRKNLTIGVKDRVVELSYKTYSKDELDFKENSKGVVFVRDKKGEHLPFVSLVPLLEIIEQIEGSKTKAFRRYNQLLESFAPEFEILLDKDLEEIEIQAGPDLAKAIGNLRKRRVDIDPGYDGVFGTIKVVFNNEQKQEGKKSQLGLF